MTDDRDPHADAGDSRPDDPAEWFTAQFDEDVDDEPADVEGFAAPRSAASALGGDYSASGAGGAAADSGFKWGLTPRTFDGDSADGSDVEQSDVERDAPDDTETGDGDVSVDTVVFSVEDDLAASDGAAGSRSDAEVVAAGSVETEAIDSGRADAESVDAVGTGAARLGEFPPPPVITRGSGDTAFTSVRASSGADATPVPVDVSLAGDTGPATPSDRSDDDAFGADQVGAENAPTDTAQTDAEVAAEAAAETGFPPATALPASSGRWTSPGAPERSDSDPATAAESTSGAGGADTAGAAELPTDLAEAAAEIPTMEEVLEAPSPRRAAREAAAKEAALREAAERAGHTGAIPLPSFTGAAGAPADTSGETTGSTPSAAPDVSAGSPTSDAPASGSQSGEPMPTRPELASPDAADLGSAPPASGVETAPEPVVGENDFAVAEPADDDIRPAGSDASLAFIAGRRPDASAPASPASRPAEVSGDPDAPDADRASADATLERPTRSAGTPLFSAPDDETATSGSDASRTAGRPARAPATTRQKVLFAVLAVVIVVALVLIILMVTSQGDASGAMSGAPSIVAQSSSSVSNGSVATSS